MVDPVRVSVALPGPDWTLEAAPTSGWAHDIATERRTLWAGGVALAALLAALAGRDRGVAGDSTRDELFQGPPSRRSRARPGTHRPGATTRREPSTGGGGSPGGRGGARLQQPDHRHRRLRRSGTGRHGRRPSRAARHPRDPARQFARGRARLVSCSPSHDVRWSCPDASTSGRSSTAQHRCFASCWAIGCSWWSTSTRVRSRSLSIRPSWNRRWSISSSTRAMRCPTAVG